MDYLILFLLAVAVVLLLILIFRKNGNDTLKGEINESIRLMGEMLMSNQQGLGRAQSDGVSAQLRQMEERLKTVETTNNERLESIRTAMTNQLAYISEENSKRLDEMRKTVDEKLEERMASSFRLVSERLEAVYKGLGEMQTLAVGVGDLKKVLSNVKTRGILGEIQLGAILSEILPVEQYETNVATVPSSKERVEFAIKLPGDGESTVYLPVDAKFPGDIFNALQDALENGDAEQAAMCRKQLVQRIRSEAKDIRDKYVMPPYTTNFAILFLPFESLYCEAVNLGLIEILQREYSISLAGPSTMAAMLNSLQMGFKTLSIQKKSAEVWGVLDAVRSEFDKFAAVLAKTQEKLRSADKELDDLVGVRTRAIQRRLKDIDE